MSPFVRSLNSGVAVLVSCSLVFVLTAVLRPIVADEVSVEEPVAPNNGAKAPDENDAGQALAEQQKWSLKYQFSPGAQLRYQSRQKMTLRATVEGAERIDISEVNQRRLFTVQTVDEQGDARLAMQFEHVSMLKKIDDQPAVEFDSAMKPEEIPVVFRQVSHGLKGSATIYFLSSLGTSTFSNRKDLQGSGVVEKSKPSAGGAENAIVLVEGDEAQKPIQLTSSSVSSDQSTKDPGTFLLPLPEGPVGVGDTWKEIVTVPVRLTADINRNVQILRTFRLDAVDGDIATISFRSSIESPVKTPSVRTQLMQAIPRGTMQFDHVQGVMTRLQMLHNQSVFGALGQNGVLACVGESTDELIRGDVEPQNSSKPSEDK